MAVAPSESARRPTESVDRLPGPDVVRAIALIGVVVMNYHGYLIIRGGPLGSSAVDRFFNPFEGPLATRFAATFVLTAGVAVTLLTRRVVASSDSTAIDEMRWRLVRRGLVLYVLGQLLDIIWNGTIIVYYGAMFVLAAVLFTLRSSWLLVVGVGSALAGWWIETWSFRRESGGISTDWLTRPGPSSVRQYGFDLFVNGTHPLFPWLMFFCAGIVLGRLLGSRQLELKCVGLGLALFGGAILVGALASTPFQRHLLSTDPLDRGLVYVASALGTALLAFGLVSALARRSARAGIDVLDPLRRAGQMTLTIYIAHILVFNLVVDWLGWIEPNGLGTALSFALGFWIVAIAVAALWHRRYGRGPAERIYRSIGG